MPGAKLHNDWTWETVVTNEQTRLWKTCQQWESIGRTNHSSWKTGTCLSQIANTMAAIELIWFPQNIQVHYSDVIMGTMAFQITSLTIVYSTFYSGTNQRKHQSSTSLAFVRGIHRSLVNSPHKGPVMQKMLPFDDIMFSTRNGWEAFLVNFCPLENYKPKPWFKCLLANFDLIPDGISNGFPLKQYWNFTQNLS